jgi:hypothetical protein
VDGAGVDVNNATLRLGRGMYDSTIEINGRDIGPAVRAVTVHAKAGHLTVVELDLLVGAATRADLADVLVTVPPAVHDALVALGWTPPGVHPTLPQEEQCPPTPTPTPPGV